MKRASHRPVITLAAIATLGAGCIPGSDEPTDPPDAEAVAQAIGHAAGTSGGAIASLSATVTPALKDINDTTTDDTLRMRIQSAIADAVVSAGCVSVRWFLASATVAFDNCQLLETGEALDGSVTVALRLLQRAVIVSFDDVTVGSNAFHGSIRAELKGPIDAPRLAVDADVTLASTSATLIVNDMTVEGSLAGVTFAGSGSVTTPTVDGSATLAQIVWARGDCLPTAGAVSFQSGRVTGAITFLATTPATGEVELRIDRLPATTVAMFPPCE